MSENPPPPPPPSSGPPPPPTPPSGGQPPTYGVGAPSAAPVRNGMGVAALVLGILSIVGSIVLIGVVLGVLAIVFGVIGRKRANRGEADTGGAALAGLITGIIGTVLSAAIIVGAVFLVTSDEFQDFNDCMNAARSEADRDQCAEDFGESLTD